MVCLDVCVDVFGFKVRNDVGRFFLAKPFVVVNNGVTVKGSFNRTLLGLGDL